MQFESLIMWALMGTGALFVTILFVAFGRMTKLFENIPKPKEKQKVVVVKKVEPVSNVRLVTSETPKKG